MNYNYRVTVQYSLLSQTIYTPALPSLSECKLFSISLILKYINIITVFITKFIYSRHSQPHNIMMIKCHWNVIFIICSVL